MAENGKNRIGGLYLLTAGLLAAVIVQGVVIFNMQRGSVVRDPVETEESVDAANPEKTSGRSSRPIDSGGDFFMPDTDTFDPFLEMRAMHESINRMFSSAFNRFRPGVDSGDFFANRAFTPEIDIEDSPEGYLVTVDLPGADDSSVEVKLDGGILTISGSAQKEIASGGGNRMLRQERRSGKFRRAIMLPEAVDSGEMAVTNKNGVLMVSIPKSAENEP